MSRPWKLIGKKRDADAEFLHHDYQPQPSTPSSKVNLEQRFGLRGAAPPNENHYENWQCDLDGYGQQRAGIEKIYENQHEILMNSRPPSSFPAPPLPPRNTPSRLHNTTINIDATTNIAAHNVVTSNANKTLNVCMNTADDDQFMETNEDMEDEEDAQPSMRQFLSNTLSSLHQRNMHNCSIMPTTPSKFQSKSSSALPRFTVGPIGANRDKNNFNQTFAAGDNIYSNLLEESRIEPPRGVYVPLQAGINPLWEGLHAKESRTKPNKLLKLSGHKLTQAVQGCRTAFATLSQKFRSSTQRRYKLDGSSPRSSSYSTPPHGSIRRTPGKLYSPFNCSTPPPPRGYEAKRLQHRLSRVFIGQENRGPKTPQSRPFKSPSRHHGLSVSFSDQHNVSVHNRLGSVVPRLGHAPHLASSAHHNTSIPQGPPPPYRPPLPALHPMHQQQPRHQYSNAAMTASQDEDLLEDDEADAAAPQYSGSAAALHHLHRQQWSSFHTPHRHNGSMIVAPATRPVPFVSSATGGHHAGALSLDRRNTTVLSPGRAADQRRSIACSRSVDQRALLQDQAPNVGAGGGGGEDDSFKRHMVEFDQMSRNITVSLARNSKFRNSVR